MLLQNPLSPTSIGGAKRGGFASKTTAGQSVVNRSSTRSASIAVNTLNKQKTKRRHPCDEEDGHQPASSAKRPRRDPTRHTESNAAPDNNSELIANWLASSNWSRQNSSVDESLQAEASTSRKPQIALPSSRSSFAGTDATSKRSERTTASVHDADYHGSLHKRNIFIEREDPLPELMRRAHGIISRPRASPEMDDAEVRKLKEKSRRYRNDAEDTIVQQMAPILIPAINEVPDRKLEMNANQPWSYSVPVPLDQDVLTVPLPLPRPMPDLAFGYSEDAFTRNQLRTIDLLVDDQFGRSYAIPDRKLRFPFLSIEFKSQAKS